MLDIDLLEKLAELRRQGTLSEEEFQAQKLGVLSRMGDLKPDTLTGPAKRSFRSVGVAAATIFLAATATLLITKSNVLLNWNGITSQASALGSPAAAAPPKTNRCSNLAINNMAYGGFVYGLTMDRRLGDNITSEDASNISDSHLINYDIVPGESGLCRVHWAIHAILKGSQVDRDETACIAQPNGKRFPSGERQADFLCAPEVYWPK